MSNKENQGVKPGAEKPQPAAANQKPQMLKLSEVWKYSSKRQKMVMYVGVLFSVLAGFTAPWIAIVMGEVISIYDPKANSDTIHDGIIYLIKMIAIISSVLWICAYIQYSFMQQAAESLAFDLRTRYLAALMKQETEFFERQQVEALPSKISEYFQAISLGLGEKLAQLIYSISIFFGGIAIAFWKGPVLAAICVAYIPFFMMAIAILGKKVKFAQITKLQNLEELGAHTEETLSALKLIVSFAQEEITIKKYDDAANKTRIFAQQAAIMQGGMGGVFYFTMFMFYVYSYGIASAFLQYKVVNPSTDKLYTTAEIVAVTQAMITSIATFGQVIPLVPAIIKALVCAKNVFDVIERVPKIRSAKKCHKTFSIDKKILFNNISFRYPTQIQKTRDIFAGATFEIKAGQSTAIVGPSGSGKSTIVQLIERYYDPKDGEILFDNTPLNKIELKQLREAIGYVSQEPVLILGTIRENLLYGNVEATEEQLENALQMASASFVFEMKDGLDTYVGASSVMNLSGGQKQRIAIARALIKKPRILILDEATSALDSKSEQEVQQAIDKIANNTKNKLTIIMIAHRLSTIQTAQNLLYLEDNCSVLAAERGTQEYSDLINRLTLHNYAHQNQDDNNQKEFEEQPLQKRFEKEFEKFVALEEVELGMGLQTDRSLVSSKIQTPLPKGKIISLKDLKQQRYSGLSKNKAKGSKSKQITQTEMYLKSLQQQKQTKTEDTQLDNADALNIGWMRIMSYYSPKSMTVVIFISACVFSCAFPILGLVTAKFQYIMVEALYSNDFLDQRNNWIVYWIIICILIATFNMLERSSIGYTGENLTYNVRKELVRGILYKQLSWFDREKRAPGVLTNVLSADISTLNGMTTETIAVVLEAFLGLVLGVSISCYYCWQESLIVLATSPVLIVGVVAMSRLQWGNNRGKTEGSQKNADVYEKANALLSDIVLNYKTVVAFGESNIESIFEKFTFLMREPLDRRIRNAHIAGFFFGYSQCSRIIYMGLIFYFGYIVIDKLGYDPKDTYMSINVLFSATMGVGLAMSNIPSIGRAKESAKVIFGIIDEKSGLDVRDGQKSQQQEVNQGEIKFINVSFQYPSRSLLVLDNFNMTIPATFKIALVGSSGCGKSTITNLLLRFYNIQTGRILIDGHDLEDYNVQNLRRQIGFVMQEPILFNQTIKENILYGNPNATDAEIRKVCEQANALQFIESNFEELDKEQRDEFCRNELSNKILELCVVQFKNLKQLSSYLDKQEYCEVLLQVLQKADDKSLNLINNRINDFIQMFDVIGIQKGNKWDDIIIKFEWVCEIQDAVNQAQQDQSINQETISQILQAQAQNQFQFSSLTLQEWLQHVSAQGQESLSQRIQKDSEKFKQSLFRRFDELTDQLIEKKKNEPLHDGFNKMCGLKGCKLSGGQKQRVAIARALIKNPKILVLDEATSALDEASQEIVQQALDRAMEGRTSIVIAHRLSTIRNCQLLFVLNKGKIIEQGSYQALSDDKNSYFNKLKAGMEM